MKLEEKIKYQYMKLFYDILNLKELDNFFKEQGVEPKRIVGDQSLITSNYLFLYNKVKLDKLTEEERDLINKYFSIDIKEINKETNTMLEETNKFLLDNIPKILFRQTSNGYINYSEDLNPINVVPADAITFVFNYIRGKSNENNLSKVFDKLNYMQNELSKEHNMKLAVIPCDETRNVG